MTPQRRLALLRWTPRLLAMSHGLLLLGWGIAFPSARGGVFAAALLASVVALAAGVRMPGLGAAGFLVVVLPLSVAAAWGQGIVGVLLVALVALTTAVAFASDQVCRNVLDLHPEHT